MGSLGSHERDTWRQDGVHGLWPADSPFVRDRRFERQAPRRRAVGRTRSRLDRPDVADERRETGPEGRQKCGLDQELCSGLENYGRAAGWVTALVARDVWLSGSCGYPLNSDRPQRVIGSGSKAIAKIETDR